MLFFYHIINQTVWLFLSVSEYCRNTGTSTRRRMMTQHCWNEMHELHPLKWMAELTGKLT